MNLFESWERLFGTLASAAVFFLLTVVLVRFAGKRTTANMNNFDWIVSIAIGSLASAGILLKNVPIVDAAAAIIALAGLQWLTAWITVRYRWAAELIKPAPRLLTHKGRYLRDAMIKERITEEEIDAVLRNAGYTELGEANWVIIETNGNLTVIPRQEKSLQDAGLLKSVTSEGV